MHETIQLKNLSIGYVEKGKGRKYIARGIETELCAGRLTCLLGANGAGKSTLLRTLSAFLPPLEGEVLVRGKRLQDYTAGERARLIGVVLTERPELHHMTVSELVGMGRSPYTNFWGTLSEADRMAVSEALRMVGMTAFAGRMVDTLSDGERQKVMIAKALAQQTPVIYLDEPTAFLDYPSKVETMLLLRRLAHETGKTVFLSTHDVELALQTADMLWLMKKERSEEGRVKREERSEERRVKSEESNTSSTRQLVNSSTCQLANSSTRQLVNLSIRQLVNSSTCQLINSSTCQLVNSSTERSLTIGSPRELADNGALGEFFMGRDFTFDPKEMRLVVVKNEE